MNKFLFTGYALFLLAFSFFSYSFVDPNLFYLKHFSLAFLTENRFIATIFLLSITILFYSFYYIFIKRISSNQLNPKDLKLIIAITVTTLFISYPAMLSFDIFNYIATSKVVFLYHENPYLVMPIEFSKEPLLAFMHAANKIALYGPTWIILTAIPYLLSFNNFLLNLFALKFFVAFFYVVSLYAIWLLCKNLLTVAYFALNPLVITETLISAHNDIVMIFFALISYYLLANKRFTQASLALLFSILIKYSTVFLIPVFIYVLYKKINNKKIDMGKVYYYSFLAMFLVFLLAPFREEIYPWYAIWFMPFALLTKNKFIVFVTLVFSFSLLLRYLPFILTGTHFEWTPLAKSVLTFLPPSLFSVLYLVAKKYHIMKPRH